MKVSGKAKFLLALTVITGTVILGPTTDAAAQTFQALDLGKGGTRFDCSTGAVEAWVALVSR